MNDIRVYIIYYVEPIAICQENHLLLLLSDVGAQQEEESAQFAGELPTALQGASGVVGRGTNSGSSSSGGGGGSSSSNSALSARTRKAIDTLPSHRRKYTVRLTKMLSNSMQALQRDEEVRVRAKSRLLTGSRGLL